MAEMIRMDDADVRLDGIVAIFDVVEDGSQYSFICSVGGFMFKKSGYDVLELEKERQDILDRIAGLE